MVDAVFDDLEGADYLAHAKIIAFDWQVLRLARTRVAGVATSHLTIPPALEAQVRRDLEGRSPWLDGFDAANHGGSQIAAIKAHGGMEWSPHFTDVTAERVGEARDLGLRVGPWGLSKRKHIAAMAALGVFSVTVSGPDWRA
jgi:glycerophosphoryl diester phosphodiesterase